MFILLFLKTLILLLFVFTSSAYILFVSSFKFTNRSQPIV